jgi:hypothetical protein
MGCRVSKPDGLGKACTDGRVVCLPHNYLINLGLLTYWGIASAIRRRQT